MNFFRHFNYEKTSLPLPAERLSCLYIQWFTYKYAICEEGLWTEILCLRTEISCVPQGNKGFGNLRYINFVRKKIVSPREHYTSFPLVTRKCC